MRIKSENARKPPIRNLSFCFGLYRKSQIKSVYIALRMKKASRRLQISGENQGESGPDATVLRR